MSFEDIDYVSIGEEHGYDSSMVKDLFDKWQHSVGDKSVDDPEGDFSEFLSKEYESDAEGETVDVIIDNDYKNVASFAPNPSQTAGLKKKVKLVKKKPTEQYQPKKTSAVIAARFGNETPDKKENFEWSPKGVRTEEDKAESESVYKRSNTSSSLAFKENAAASQVEEALKSHDTKHVGDNYGIGDLSSSSEEDDYENEDNDHFDLDAARIKFGLVRKVGDSILPRSLAKPKEKQQEPSTTSALDSWDDIVDAIENLSDEEDDHESGSSENAQEKLRDMLVGEAMRINDDITSSKLVLVLIPELSISQKMLDNVTKSRKEKTKFVTGSLITMTGTQPESQLFDRPYRAIDGSEYNWPSTGTRRLVGQRNTVYIGSTEKKITNQHGKSIKPVYVADSK